MRVSPPFPSVDRFPSSDYRLINASVPVCHLDANDGGDAASDAIGPATLIISAGKILQIRTNVQAAAVSDGLPAIDLDGGMVWPVCADLHTHLDKGHIWFRAPNASGRWQDARTIVAEDREDN